MVVEGVNTAQAALKLAKKHNVSMPITEAINGVLFDGKIRERPCMTYDERQDFRGVK